MPAIAMCCPATIWRRMVSKSETMSPDQTSVPMRWLPAQAQRSSVMISSSPAAFKPSYTICP